MLLQGPVLDARRVAGVMMAFRGYAVIAAPYTLALLLLTLSLPPFSITMAGVIAFVPFFAARLRKNSPRSILCVAAFGAGLAAYDFLGAVSYSPLLYGLLILLFGSAYALYGVVASYLLQRAKFAPVWLGIIWCTIEYILNNLGVPYSHSVYLASGAWLIQLADIGGQNIVAGVAMVWQAAIARWLVNLRDSHGVGEGRHTDVYLLLSLMTIVVTYGAVRLFTPGGLAHSLSAAAVQSNVPPVVYLQAHRDGGIEAMSKHRERLKNELDASAVRPDLVVWPELSFAGFELRHSSWVTESVRGREVDTLLYSVDLVPDGNITSAVFGVSPASDVVSRSGKVETVPFAESDITKLKNREVHRHLAGSPISLICLESALPINVSAADARDSRLIAVSVNDAYAGPSILPLIHVEFAKLRAVEMRRPLVRSANSGVSAIITAQGRIQQALPMYSDGILIQSIESPSVVTIYVEYGAVILALVASTGILLLGATLILVWGRENGPWFSEGAAAAIVLFIGCSMAVVQYVGAHSIILDGIERNNIYRSEFSDGALPVPMFESLTAESLDDAKLMSLVFLLRKHGLAVTAGRLREGAAMPDERLYQQGRDLISIAQSLGYALEQASADNGRVYVPSMVRMRNGSSAVVVEFGWSEVTIFDPLHGREIRISRDSFMRGWTREYYRLVSQPRPWDIVH